MIKLSLAYSCPNCQNKFIRKQLIKKPFKGTLKWYQMTPAPSLHCPHCEQRLVAVLPNQFYFTLIAMSLPSVILMLIDIMDLFLVTATFAKIFQGAGLLIALYFAIQTDKNIVYQKADE